MVCSYRVRKKQLYPKGQSELSNIFLWFFYTVLKCNLPFLKMSNKKKRRENTEHNFQNYLATCSLVFREGSILQMILPESCNIIIPNLQPMTIAIHLYLSTLEDVQRKYIALNLTEQVRQNSYTVPCPRPKQQ